MVAAVLLHDGATVFVVLLLLVLLAVGCALQGVLQPHCTALLLSL
jgi:hypothetical protein